MSEPQQMQPTDEEKEHLYTWKDTAGVRFDSNAQVMAFVCPHCRSHMRQKQQVDGKNLPYICMKCGHSAPAAEIEAILQAFPRIP